MFYLNILFFFFNDTATTEIYTLSLHDALPISLVFWAPGLVADADAAPFRHADLLRPEIGVPKGDRKSTRLNSSHSQISYAVFCLKKKTVPPPPRRATARAALLRVPVPSAHRRA